MVFAQQGDPSSSITSQLRLAFALSDGTATCTVDGAERACSGGVLVDELTSGDSQTVRHAVPVVATDLAGNPGTPVQLVWSFLNTTIVG